MRTRTQAGIATAAFLAVALLASACGGADDGERTSILDSQSEEPTSQINGEDPEAASDAGTPAELDTSGGSGTAPRTASADTGAWELGDRYAWCAEVQATWEYASAEAAAEGRDFDALDAANALRPMFRGESDVMHNASAESFRAASRLAVEAAQIAWDTGVAESLEAAQEFFVESFKESCAALGARFDWCSAVQLVWDRVSEAEAKLARARRRLDSAEAVASAAQGDELGYAEAAQALAAAESDAAQAEAAVFIRRQVAVHLLHASRSGEPGDHRIISTERGEAARLKGTDVVDPFDETLRVAMARAGDAFDSNAAGDTLDALRRAAAIGDAIAGSAHAFREAGASYMSNSESLDLVNETVTVKTGHNYDNSYFAYVAAYWEARGSSLRAFRRPWDSLFTEHKPEDVDNGTWGVIDNFIEGVYGHTYTKYASTDTAAYTAYKQSFHESCES